MWKPYIPVILWQFAGTALGSGFFSSRDAKGDWVARRGQPPMETKNKAAIIIRIIIPLALVRPIDVFIYSIFQYYFVTDAAILKPIHAMLMGLHAQTVLPTDEIFL